MTRRRTSGRPHDSARLIGDRQWERDALVWLVGEVAAPILPSDVSDVRLGRAQDCYWEWLGREAIQRATAEEVARTAAAASDLAERLSDRGLRVHRVRCVDGRPTFLAPLARGSVPQVLERARQAGAAPLVELGVAAGAGRALWDEPSDVWVALPPAAGLPDRRYVALRVVGDSMLPLLHPQDIVLVDLDGEVTSGAIIVARSADEDGASGSYVVKRVGGASEETLELTSLNPNYPPLIIPREGQRLLGPVVLRWHQAVQNKREREHAPE